MTSTKTVGEIVNGHMTASQELDPMHSLKREAVERMRIAMLSSSLDDPLSASAALRQVTAMRVYHQVARIIQYIDLMDALEERLFESVQIEIASLDFSESNFHNVTKLLAIQEKLQKAIIDSNKLLAPYLDMEQYPAFAAIEAATPVSAQILDIPSNERNVLRENAGAILEELKTLSKSGPNNMPVSLE